MQAGFVHIFSLNRPPAIGGKYLCFDVSVDDRSTMLPVGTGVPQSGAGSSAVIAIGGGRTTGTLPKAAADGAVQADGNVRESGAAMNSKRPIMLSSGARSVAFMHFARLHT